MVKVNQMKNESSSYQVNLPSYAGKTQACKSCMQGSRVYHAPVLLFSEQMTTERTDHEQIYELGILVICSREVYHLYMSTFLCPPLSYLLSQKVGTICLFICCFRTTGQAQFCSAKHPQPLVQYLKHDRCPTNIC